MGKAPARRRRWGWEVPAELRRRNPVGDWALRTGLAAFGLPLLLTLGAAAMSDGYTVLAVVWIALILAGVLGLAALLLGIAGLAAAQNRGCSAHSAWWGLSLGVLLLGSGLLAVLLA